MFKTYNDLEKIDLHIHSCYSDGELTPAEIIEKWISDGYKTIAITDHDGIEGSRIGQEFSLNKDIEFITGIEFDSENEYGFDFHMLGYDIDLDSKVLNDNVETIYKWRCERNDVLIAAINKLGYDLTVEDVNAVYKGTYVGKPTIAKALIAKGYAKDVSDAFSNIIQKAGDGTANRKKSLPTKHVIDVIHEAGGKAVFAHPIEQKKNGETWEEFKPKFITMLNAMIEWGIDGVECFHPSASEEQSKFLVEFAEKSGLIITKGSDFHSDKIKRDYSKYHK